MAQADTAAVNARRRAHYQANRERLLATAAKTEATPEGRAWRLLRRCRERAKAKGWTFDLDIEWMRAGIARGCALSGVDFDLERSPRGRTNARAPSVDRIDSTGGYTKENCRMVCWVVNLALGQWGDEVFDVLARVRR